VGQSVVQYATKYKCYHRAANLLLLDRFSPADVGQSVVHYAKENGVDLVVLGARGMGSWKRAIMSFVGLGSVSDFVVHHLEAPVIIVKHQ
jgi:nucleotide-binding universal stress UspA family protein